MATRSNERIRFRYGICLNDNCSKCKTKEVQEIPARKELVCAECGKPLRECPPPKTGPNKAVIGGIAAAVVAVVIGGGIFAFSGGSEPEEKAAEEVTAVQDTTATEVQTVEEQPAVEAEPKQVEEAPVKEEPKAAAPKASTPKQESAPKGRSRGTVNLGYGSYSGDLLDGKPDGAGLLTFTRSQQITSSVTAEKGDRLDGVFQNGKITTGTLTRTDGQVVKVRR